MGEVIVTFKIMPKSVETNLDKLEEKIKKEINPQRITREPLAFGLKILMVTKLVPDSEGELQKIEDKLKSFDGVGEIEVTEITRSL